MGSNIPFFLIRHARSEENANQDNCLTANNKLIDLAQGALDEFNFNPFISFLEQNPKSRFFIISSDYVRAEKTARYCKKSLLDYKNENKLDIDVFGPFTDTRIGEWNQGSEIRVTGNTISHDLYGEQNDKKYKMHDPNFWQKSFYKKILPKNSFNPLDGESLQQLFERTSNFASDLRGYSVTGDISFFTKYSKMQYGFDQSGFLEGAIPIIISHSVAMNGIFRELGLVKVNNYNDLVKVDNALPMLVCSENGRFCTEINLHNRILKDNFFIR